MSDKVKVESLIAAPQQRKVSVESLIAVDVKKKEQAVPEEFISSMRGASVKPDEFDLEAQSISKVKGEDVEVTQVAAKEGDTEVEATKVEAKKDPAIAEIESKTEEWYTSRGVESPITRIDKYSTQITNLAEHFKNKSEEWKASGISEERIRERFDEQSSSLAKALGLDYSEGTVTIPENDLEFYKDLYMNEARKLDKGKEKDSFIKDVAQSLDEGMALAGLGMREIAGKLLFLDQIEAYRTANEEQREYIELGRKLDVSNKRYDESTEELLDQGRYAEAAGSATLSAVESLPSLMLMFSSPQYGLLAGGLLAANEKAEELEDVDAPEYIKGLNIVATGLLEIGTEKLTTIPMINKAKKAILEVGEDAYAKSVTEATETALRTAFRRAGLGAQDVVLESASEGLNQYGQNIVKKITIDPDQNPMEGVVDAMAAAVATSGIIKSPNIAIETPQRAKAIAKEAIAKAKGDDITTKVESAMEIVEKEHGVPEEEVEAKKVVEEAEITPEKPEIKEEEVEVVKEPVKEEIVEEKPEKEPLKEEPEVIKKEVEKKEPEVKEKVKEVVEEVEPVKEEKPVEEVKKPEKKIEPKEQFKQDFLSDEINLQGIDIPLNAKERAAARKNLLEGKKTKQAEMLEQYLDESFDKGTMSLVQGTGKLTERTEAPLESIIKKEIEPIKEEVKDAEESAQVRQEVTEEGVQREEQLGDMPELTKEEVKPEEKIKIPKEKKAVSERFLQKEALERGKETEAYKVVEKESKKTEYSQEESFQEGSEIIKRRIDESGNVDEVGVFKDLEGRKPDVGNFALSTLHEVYNKRSQNETLSEEERQIFEQKAANIVNRMADRALEQGRGGASWAKIYKANPAFDARVRFVNELGRDKANVLQRPYKAGQTVQEYINSVREEIETEVRTRLDEVLAENKEIKKEIEKIKKSKGKFGKEEAKKIADKVRKLKTPKDLAFATAIPIQAVWDPAVELVAKAIEATGELADAIRQGLDYVKNSKWYQDLNSDEQKRFDKFFKQKLEEELDKKNIEDVVRDHYVDKEDLRTLTEKLIEDAGLTKKQASKIKSIVGKEISKRTKQKLLKIHKQRDTGIKPHKKARLLEAIREGALETEEFTNLFAEKFGFSEISEDARVLIEKLVKDIDKLKAEGKHFLSQQRMLELGNEFKKLRPKEQKDVYKAYTNWLHLSVLSGVNTFYNAGIGGLSSLTIEALPKLITKGLIPAAYGGVMGAKQIKTHLKEFVAITNTNRGLYDQLGILDESHTNREEGVIEQMLSRPFFGYSKKIADKILGKKDAAEVENFWGEWFKTTMAKGLVVTSLIKAQDALLRGSATDIITAAEEFNRVSEEYGHKGLIGRFTRMKDLAAIMEKTTKNLGMDKVTKEAINIQVDNEIAEMKELGEKIPPNYKSRRAYELRIEKGNTDGYENTMQSTSDWIMLGEPDGVAGWIYRGLKQKLMNFDTIKSENAQLGAFVLKSTLLFPRMSANFINAVSRNMPVVGMINAVMGYDVNVNGEGKWTLRKEDTAKMTQRIATNAAITMAGFMLFGDMFDWDDDEERYILSEDRHWDFTSYGTGNYKKDIQLGIDKNFAFRYRKDKDSEWSDWHGTYLAPHIMPMIGFLGRWADDEKGIGNEDQIARRNKNWMSKTSSIFDVSFRALEEAQYNSISRAVKQFKKSKDKGAGAMTAVTTAIMQPLKAYTQPAIVRDGINELYRSWEVNKKDAWANFTNEVLKGYYVAELFMKHEITDIYGNTVPRDTKLWSFQSKYKKKYYDLPEYKLLNKYETFKRPDIFWMPNNKDFDITERMDAREFAKKSFGGYIKDNLKFLDKLDQKDLEQAMDVMWSFARKDGTYMMMYKNSNPKATENDIDKAFDRYRNANKKEMEYYESLIGTNMTVDEMMVDGERKQFKKEVKTVVGK